MSIARWQPDEGVLLGRSAAGWFVSFTDHQKEVRELKETLRMFLNRMTIFGEWDDGCFYYNRTSASELQEPILRAQEILGSLSV